MTARTTTAKEAERARKEAAARQRACFDEEIVHVRVGDWQTNDAHPPSQIRVVGLCRDLHGTACTCCTPTSSITTSTTDQPRRTA